MRSPLIADSVLPMTKLAKTLRGVVSEAWLTRHLLEQPQGAPPQGAPPAPPAPAPQAGPAIDPNTLPPEVAALVQQDPSILQNPELLQQLIAAAQQSAAGQPAPGQPPAGTPPAGDPGAPAGAPPGPPAGGPPPGPAGSSDPVGDLMRQQGLPTDPQAGGPQMPGQPGEDPAGGPPGAPPGPPPGPPTDYPSPNELPPEAQPPNAQDAAAIHQLKPFMNNGKDDLSPDGTPKPRPDRYRQPGPGDEGAIRRFLKDNPNATDDDFHNFAMRIGLDPHDAEGVVLKLANIGAKSSNDDSDGGEGEDDHKKSKKESIDPWFTRGPLSLDRRFLRPGLDESDANFRAAERQSAATGAPSDRAAHVVGLVRAGRLDELLRQHAERLHAAHEAVRAAHAAEQLHLELTRDNPDTWRDPKTGTLSRQHEAAKQARQQTVDEFKRDAETIGAGDRPEDLLHTQHFHGLTTTPHEHIQNPTPDDARDERLLHLTAIGHVLGLTPLRHGYGLSSLTMTGVRNTENQDVNKLQANVNRFTEVARKLYGKRSVQHSGHRMQFDPNGNEHSLYGSSLPERGFVQMPGVVLPRRAVPGRRVAGTSTGRAVGRINPPTVESDESGSHADHYLAITLDDASRAKLAAFGKGATADEKGFQIQPEHVTLKHDLTPEDMEWAQKHIGTAINMRATHHASMPGLHAVRVEPIGKHGRDLIARAGKEHPHVTVAYDHTRAKPAQSNDLLASSPGTRLSKYLNIGGTVQLLPKTPTAAHEDVDYIQRRFLSIVIESDAALRAAERHATATGAPTDQTAHVVNLLRTGQADDLLQHHAANLYNTYRNLRAADQMDPEHEDAKRARSAADEAHRKAVQDFHSTFGGVTARPEMLLRPDHFAGPGIPPAEPHEFEIQPITDNEPDEMSAGHANNIGIRYAIGVGSLLGLHPRRFSDAPVFKQPGFVLKVSPGGKGVHHQTRRDNTDRLRQAVQSHYGPDSFWPKVRSNSTTDIIDGDLISPDHWGWNGPSVHVPSDRAHRGEAVVDEGLFDSIRGLAQRVLGKTPPPSTTAHRQPRTPSIQTPEERQKEHEAAVDWYVKNQEVQAKKWAGVVHETLPKRPKARAGRASGPTAAPTAASLANTNILPHNPFDAQARARLASKTTGKLPVKNPDESGAESPEDLLLRQWANKRRSEQSIVRQSLAINEADTAARGAEREHRRDGTPETLARHFVNLQRTGQWNWDDRARQHAERMHAALNVVRDRREEEDRAKDAFQPAKEETHQRHLASAAHQSTVNDFKRDVDAYNVMNNTQHQPESLLLPSYYSGIESSHAAGHYGVDYPNHHHVVALGHVIGLRPTWNTDTHRIMAMPDTNSESREETKAKWARYTKAAHAHHGTYGDVAVDYTTLHPFDDENPSAKIAPMKMPQFRIMAP